MITCVWNYCSKSPFLKKYESHLSNAIANSRYIALNIHYLSPVFEEVFPEGILGSVLMVQHFGKEGGYLLSFGAELHLLPYIDFNRLVKSANPTISTEQLNHIDRPSVIKLAALEY